MKTLLKRSVWMLPLMTALSVISPSMAVDKGIVMDFGAVDTLKALGKADRISALPIQNLPAYLSDLDLKDIQNSGGMKSPDLAVFAELKPQFIVISPRLGGRVDELSEYGKVLNFTVDSDHYAQSVATNILALAELVDAESEAKASLDVLNGKLDQVRAEIAQFPQTALVMIHNDGHYMATPTSGTAKFIHQFLGVKNAAPEVPQPTEQDKDARPARQAVDEAYLNNIQPDLIFVVDRSSAIGQTPMDQSLFETNVVSKAMNKDGKAIKVIYLDPTLWYLSGNGLISIETQANEVLSALKDSSSSAQ
ncbi:ABC transporter substrate-binding protein [Ignatzschineria larvae DSM 13226]|uniref:ABC transporter substrate-binding protein n=1 Tax=Ignatzschineria larvae DSM 13226 TaxID=1111732 RepID=A0ABZ3BZ61_9GAMM|nr:ABC transporter substrate-binding protein [Ignatzschineria larvae]